MELTDLVKILKKEIVFLAVAIFIGALVGFYSTRFFSSGYLHIQHYFLTEARSQEVSDNLNREIYYSQEKNRNFTDTAIAILESPDFKSEVVKKGDSLVVRKSAPQVIKLTYISKSPDENNTSLNNVKETFNSKIKALTESTSVSQLKPIGDNLPPVYSALNKFVLALAGSVLGIFFATFVIGLKNYLRI